jgi:hypothetical protein
MGSSGSGTTRIKSSERTIDVIDENSTTGSEVAI